MNIYICIYGLPWLRSHVVCAHRSVHFCRTGLRVCSHVFWMFGRGAKTSDANSKRKSEKERACVKERLSTHCVALE